MRLYMTPRNLISVRGNDGFKIMIVNERIVTYIQSLDRPNSPVCEEIEAEARAEGVPIIRKEMESFLHTMIDLKKPKRILEVGAAVGYSALIMAQWMPQDCHIVTIELDEERIRKAKDNFKRAGMGDRITLLEGDAAEILPTLKDGADLVFMDAAKGQYLHFLPDILRLMEPGSVMISDNILQDGDLIESRFGVARRNRTIHSRMREYVYTIKNHPKLTTSIVPLGDGIAISVKKQNLPQEGVGV